MWTRCNQVQGGLKHQNGVGTIAAWPLGMGTNQNTNELIKDLASSWFVNPRFM